MAPKEPKDTGPAEPPWGVWYGDGLPAEQSAAASEQADVAPAGSPQAETPTPPPLPPELTDTKPALAATEPLLPPVVQTPVQPQVTPPTAPPLPPEFPGERTDSRWSEGPIATAPAVVSPVTASSTKPPSWSATVATPCPDGELQLAPDEQVGTAELPILRSGTPAADGEPPPSDIETDIAIEEPSLFRLYVDFAPAWLTSFIVHTALMIFFAAMMLAIPTTEPPITISLRDFKETEEIDEGHEIDLPEEIPEEPVEIIEPEAAELAELDIPPEDTDVAALQAPEPEPLGDFGDPKTTGLQSFEKAEGSGPTNLLAGRAAGMKRRLLRDHGGTAQTESAVTAGLAWLVRQQQRNGEWRLNGRFANASGTRNSEAASAMALLAFQGAGYTHKTGEGGRFRPTVRRGWYWLLRRQGKDGCFADRVSDNHHYYTHALCTFALCELYAMTGDKTYRTPAQKAVNYLVRNQHKEGGWRYRRGGSDLSVSGWVMMALQSARMGNLKVPEETLDRYRTFLDKAGNDYGSKYSYMANEDNTTRAMTAEGLLCRQYLGWDHGHPALTRGSRYLLERPIHFRNRNHDVYGWYYATQVLHHMGGDMWKEWNRSLSKNLPARQVKKGDERGSWSPRGDRFGGEGGRLYTTCLSIYMLEVYYRHLPIYSTDLSAPDRNRADRKQQGEGEGDFDNTIERSSDFSQQPLLGRNGE